MEKIIFQYGALKNYKLATIILLAPAYILMELGHVYSSLSGGWFKEKVKVWQYFLRLETWTYLIRARRETQALRVRLDREIIKRNP